MKLKNILEKYTKEYSYNLDKIVGINPFDFDTLYLLDNGKLSQISKKEMREEYLLSSYIPNKNILSYELRIQKNLLDKIEIEDYIETKAYEEMSLDEVEEYIFKYKMINLEHDEKNVLFEVIIISKKEIEEYYRPIKEAYGHLDFITYSGYIYNVLYKEKILDRRNDLFIYFTRDEIIITLYGEGEFLQTFIIPDGLYSIYEELTSSIKIKNFDFDKFLFVLGKKGLDISNYAEREEQLFNILTELFSNTFITISTQLHSITRKFSLTTIDRIFMSGIKGSIPGISDFANMYLGVEANDLRFDKPYNPDGIEIEQMTFISMLYAQYCYKNDYQNENFTVYYRSPTFFYRTSGQFISVTIGSFILAILFPTYQYLYGMILESSNASLKSELETLKQEEKRLKQQHKNLKKKYKQREEDKKKLLTYIDNASKIIDQIYAAKKDYTPKAAFLAKLSLYLHKHHVYVKEILYSNLDDTDENKNKKNLDGINKYMILNVYAKDSKDITNFIQDFVMHENRKVNTTGYVHKGDKYVSQIMIKVDK